MLTDGLECCDVFIRLSFWRHPFTAEHPLTLILTAPIHCRASIAETHFSKPDEETNSSDLGWSESEHVFVLTWFRNRSEDEHKPSGSCRPSRCEGCRTERVPVLSLRASTTPADLTHKHSSVHEKPWSWITMYSIFKQVIQLLAYCFFIVDMFCATYASLFTILQVH